MLLLTTTKPEPGNKCFLCYQQKVKQVSAVTDELARHAASRQTCCKQRWTLCVINLRPK